MKTKLTRKKIETIILCCVGAAIIIAMSIIPAVSWGNYRNYINSLVKPDPPAAITDPVMQGISLRLADGKEYFDNGKASPVKGDFVVEATYSISETESYADVLTSDAFSLEVPDGFAQSGGTVTVKHVETTGEGEEAQSKEFSASLDITLTPVKLARLYCVSKPYTVAYTEGQNFDTTGMTLEAAYNDGTIVQVGDAYSVINGNSLVAGTKEVDLSFTYNDETVTMKFPVSVMLEAEFTNGAVTEIADGSSAKIVSGEHMASAQTHIWATHESGNRALLSADDYSLVGNNDTVLLGDKKTLKIKTNGDNGIECDIPLEVVSSVEAENATISGGGDVSDGSVNVSDGVKAEFTVNASVDCSGSVTIRLAGEKPSGRFELKINGAINAFGKPVASDDGTVEITARNAVFYKGSNTFAIEYAGEGSADVDCFTVSSFGDARSSVTLGEYMAIVEKNDVSFDKNLITSLMTADNFDAMRDGCTDGENLYYLITNNYSNSGKLVRYGMAEGGIVAKSETITIFDDSEWHSETGCVFYKDGSVIVLDGYGKLLAYDAQTLEYTGEYDLKFPGIEDDDDARKEGSEYIIRDIEYNAETDRWAVAVVPERWYPWAYLYVFDGEMNMLCRNKQIKARDEVRWGGYNMRALFGNGNYFYAVYDSGGDTQGHTNECTIKIFDWSGNDIDEVTFTGLSPLGTPLCNVYNAVELGDSLYIGMYNHSGRNGCCIYKIDYKNLAPEPNTLTVKTSELYIDGEKVMLKLTGTISDYTRDDLALQIEGVKIPNWTVTNPEFDLTVSGYKYVLTADVSAELNDLTNFKEGDPYDFVVFLVNKSADNVKIKMPICDSQVTMPNGNVATIVDKWGNGTIRVYETGWAITSTELVVENDKPIVKITGTVVGYTKDDFELYSIAIKGWPWPRHDYADFDMQITGMNFTVTVDISYIANDTSGFASGDNPRAFIHFKLKSASGDGYIPSCGTTVAWNGKTLTDVNLWGSGMCIQTT